MRHSQAYTDLARLDVLAWDFPTESPQLDGYSRYFLDRPEPLRYADRMEHRQAEFLGKDTVEIKRISRIGGIDERRAGKGSAILDAARVDLRIDVMRDWYFLGQ